MTNRFFALCEWIYYLICINMLWLRYTLFGGLFFSLIPATVTVYDCLRKLILEHDETTVSQVYKTYYRVNKPRYKNVSCISFLLIGTILFLYTLMGTYASPPFPFEFAVRSNLFLFLLLSIVFFPVHAYFTLSKSKMIIQPLAFIFICPLQTVASLMMIGMVGFVYRSYPLLGICLGIGLPAYCISRLFLKKFVKMNGVFF
ncbi:hypothetical protein A5886_000623 [Enterococcus sp. 8G7_MSG3316]|uniref:DUF624 domain-containing protein n=1 Tax=Candidatus Enterococcus testudinis TaxID=1834191 RepID=A0A242A3Q2_9ENTE|nr:DUF624 domain-containing protein [Enterococcus sp. 8G7_MSG3316]OTN75549.1 hypothetical protein A5886_000623 [Enterococcus sp. 8G7_MSG3316]